MEMNKAMELLRGLVSEIERQTCEHEETHRGGAIWEICDSCGAKWADDEGGKPEFEWPESVEKAREFLAAHPAVEQAGGDERVIGWRERILAAHPNSDPGFWPNALLVEHMAAEIADLRAALAQPSPVQELDFSKPLETENGEPVKWICADVIEYKSARVCVAKDTGLVYSSPYVGLKIRNVMPEQVEAERPEVVARVVHSNPVVLDHCAPLNANDELMTVSQHAASVARWAEMFNRVEQERDAALARVAELDKQCRDDVARALGLRPSQERGFAWSYLLASIKSCVKESKDAAQAQHSVPEGWKLVPEDATLEMVEALKAELVTTSKGGILRAGIALNAAIAAAPGKEGL
ncbi:TPA: hypothetical protein L4V44_004532 [Pseudomonas aeruginosa]|nr:hypothetical protein [Pseudomonas aeruginosa]